MSPLRSAIPAAFLLTLATPAFAHASFETPEVTQNSSYKAVIRIGHGCNGEATHTVRVVVPEGVIAAKPMPKAGWTVATETGVYAKSYDLYGKPVSHGAKAIVWSGGKLGDDQYDEFVFQARMTDALPAGKKLYVPVTQICANGTQAWVEVPVDGQDAHGLKSPAPALLIKAAPQQMAQASGHDSHAGHGTPVAAGLAVSMPWTRATPPGSKVAGGFLTIANTGKSEDRLIGGSVDAAAIFEVHEMAMENGIMKMRALDKGLAIPAGGKVELKPGGYHVMFIDLKRPIAEGETLKGELLFEKAGKVPVEFKAMAIGAKAGGHHGH